MNLIGTTLKGRYRLYDQLATGGSATVFLARDLMVGRMVVVKVVHDHMIDRRFLARFVREINILKDAQSPHIVSIYDFAIDHTQEDLLSPVTFIAMAYIEGLTLARIIRRLETISEQNTLALARQIALGLDELYRLGIVHRDLKAPNLMIQADDTVLILDFGIARNLNEDTLTGANIFAGTLAYAAPEQMLDARSVDIRADLYSLGVIMAECLTGHLPPRGRSGEHMLSSEFLESVNRERPAASGKEILNCLLALKPEMRYETPQELISDLDGLLAGASLALPWDSLGVEALPAPEVPRAVQTTFCLESESGIRVLLDATEYLVGRSTSKDTSPALDIDLGALDLSNPKTISRRHCRLTRADSGGFFIEDLGSFNGTWVNGVCLVENEKRLLLPGNDVHLGAELFKFLPIVTEHQHVVDNP